MEKPLAGDAFVAWIRIWKMGTDISLPHSTQQGIHQSMQEHIGIRMPCQSKGIRDLHSAENELSAALKSMDVKTVPYTIITNHELKAHLPLQEILMIEEDHRHLASFFQDDLLLTRHDQPLSQ